jgi:hypothetical protein
MASARRASVTSGRNGRTLGRQRRTQWFAAGLGQCDYGGRGPSGRPWLGCERGAGRHFRASTRRPDMPHPGDPADRGRRRQWPLAAHGAAGRRAVGWPGAAARDRSDARGSVAGCPGGTSLLLPPSRAGPGPALAADAALRASRARPSRPPPAAGGTVTTRNWPGTTGAGRWPGWTRASGEVPEAPVTARSAR